MPTFCGCGANLDDLPQICARGRRGSATAGQGREGESRGGRTIAYLNLWRMFLWIESHCGPRSEASGECLDAEREKERAHNGLHGRVRLDDERVAKVRRLAALLGVDAVEAHRLHESKVSVR